ncbi:hypothetical protein ACFZCG_24375 [Streptomyces tanashiensis]|uniref:hypothetical protein n=1 Tax=Streptomyces tanashiensis TaxID=67367 RepID=UPI0036EDA96E
MAAALTAVGLLVVLVVADLDTGDKVASLVGAILAGAGLVVAVLSLVRDNAPPVGREVRAGQGGVAAGGDITGSALGASSRVSTQPPGGPAPVDAAGAVGPPAGSGSVIADPGGIAAGGDISGSALGEGSQVQ